MKNLGHVQRIELLHGLNDMTSELKSFLVIISLCFIVLWNVSLNCCWFWSLFSLLDITYLCLRKILIFFLYQTGTFWWIWKNSDKCRHPWFLSKSQPEKAAPQLTLVRPIDKLHLLTLIFKISNQRSKPISTGIVWVNTAFCTRSFTAPSLLHSKGFKHETATPVSCWSLLWSWSHKQARNNQAFSGYSDQTQVKFWFKLLVCVGAYILRKVNSG